MTKIQIMPAWKDVKPSGYYVYLHRKASDMAVFYVGKGLNKRGWAISRDNKYWNNICKKHGCTIEIAQDNMSEDDAFLLEMWLIAKFRNSGVALCNLTDGGEGPSGANSTLKVPVYSSLSEAFESITDARDFLRLNGYPTASESNIISTCKGRHEFCYGRSWSYDDYPTHPLVTSNKVTNGDRVVKTMSKTLYRCDGMVFKNARMAMNSLIINGVKNPSQWSIARQARNGGVAYGYRWSYEGKPERDGVTGKENHARLLSKPVATECGMRFDSIKKAVDYLRNEGYKIADGTGISKCCNGRQSTCCGYKWRFT